MSVVHFHPGRGGQRQTISENSSLVAVLDIGTTKIACLIAEVLGPKQGGEPGELKIRGFGHQASRGVKAGAIVDLEAADRAIRLTVDAAERMAGKTIGEVVVGVAGGRPRCVTITAKKGSWPKMLGAAKSSRPIPVAFKKSNRANGPCRPRALVRTNTTVAAGA